jgi:hypothetical protein
MTFVKTALGLVAVAIVAGGAYFFVRQRATQPRPELASVASVPPAADSTGNTRPATPEPEVPPVTSATLKKMIPPPEPDPGAPLRTGEILDFTADVAKVSNVATLRLQVAERRSLAGKNAWHLQAFAHTQNPLRMVFELDDQFDSYSDPATLVSLQYEMHLNERGQKVDSVQRMTVTGREPATGNASQTHVLSGTRDPLGMMQFLRHVDWSKTREVRAPVYDGHKLYDVRASLAGAGQPVSVPAGSFTADKVEIRVFDNGAEMKDAHFFVYFAHNQARTPVLLEAEMPFASARVALKTAN